MTNRVVVTGIGVVSPLGLNSQTTWQALLEGKSGAGLITHFDASSFGTKIACEVKGFDPLQYIDRKRVRRMDRFTQFAVAATFQAIFSGQESSVDAHKSRGEGHQQQIP